MNTLLLYLHWLPVEKRFVLKSSCGGGGETGGGRPGEKGTGGVREAGEEGAGSGIPKVAGSRRKRGKLRNIAQNFAIAKMQRGGSQQIQGGNREV